jgi:hypothetical protein
MFYNNAAKLLDIPSSKNIAEEMLRSLENCSFMNNTVDQDAFMYMTCFRHYFH